VASVDSKIAGTVLTEGSYVISDWANMLLCDNLDIREAKDGSAHPMFGYIATQCGIGVGIGELLKIAGSDASQGPMLASVDLVLSRPLEIAVEYRVTGEILQMTRKTGRKTGPFDLLTFVERLIDPAGEVAAECTNAFVVPRRGEG
jgi:hypothetical protein